jgi:hypothetical protein
MIIVKLCGGIGNQMFQVAAGLALAVHYKTDLKFDINFFRNVDNSSEIVPSRKFRIGAFNRKYEIADMDEISLFSDGKKSIANRLKSYLIKPVRLIDSWDPTGFINKSSKNVYLDGYFQSEDYFSDYKALILEYFKFPELEHELLPIAKGILETNSVSLHFRRGDYTGNEDVKKIHNVCDAEYYRKAIEYIKKYYQDIELYLFSDEPDWIRENFESLIKYSIVSTGSDINDMHLMSLCKHNIIANSSFSWWAAWLNRYINKTVIAPVKWFAYDIVNQDHIVPDGWIRI